MYSFIPLGPDGLSIRVNEPKRKTRIMAILNLTPDSFSDGGIHKPDDVQQLMATISGLTKSGAEIIDIGGQSSRPNAPDVTAEEEIARIVPVIRALKSLPDATAVVISVDTYRAEVAEAAVNAGAHIINDISAGMLDPNMLPTIAKLGCTYVMMHMRGTPSTMQSEENCSYPNGLVPTIAQYFYRRVVAAEQAGIRRWRIILDPGIGFSKTPEQNLELLRNLSQLRENTLFGTMPWLIGSSRKSFIGKVTGVQNPRERGWGTAATVTAAVQGGADIVRVHDVAEMADVVKMADAMYRV